MNASRIVRKVLYYSDLKLLLKVLTTSLKISFVSLLEKEHLLVKPASLPRLESAKQENKEKVIRYVNLCLFLRKKLGIRDTCFSRSLFICHMLRQAGLDARVSFGAKRAGERMIGHCWLNQVSEKNIDYQVIFTYP